MRKNLKDFYQENIFVILSKLNFGVRVFQFFGDTPILKIYINIFKIKAIINFNYRVFPKNKVNNNSQTFLGSKIYNISNLQNKENVIQTLFFNFYRNNMT